MRPYSPGGILNALAAAPKGSKPPTPSTHRLRRGLPGYLILFAPPAFVPQCQYCAREPPSPPVFLLISTHFTATPRIPFPSHILYSTSFECSSTVEPWDFTSDLVKPPTDPLRPVIPNNAWTPRITAAAGTKLAGASLKGTVKSESLFTLDFLPLVTEVYNPKAFIPHAALLRQTFAHCAKFPTAASRRSLGRISVPVWLIILSDQLPIVSLGRPLPYQQANGTQAHPKVRRSRRSRFRYYNNNRRIVNDYSVLAIL